MTFNLKLEPKPQIFDLQEQELLNYIAPADNYNVCKTVDNEFYSQTYTRINSEKITINVKLANPERKYSVLYILKVNGSDLVLSSLTEFSDNRIIEYAAGYVFIRLPQGNTKANWHYLYGDYIITECESEIGEMKINGTKEDVLIVTRTYKVIDPSMVNKSGKAHTEKEIYVAGKGRILTDNE